MLLVATTAIIVHRHTCSRFSLVFFLLPAHLTLRNMASPSMHPEIICLMVRFHSDHFNPGSIHVFSSQN